MMDTREIMDYLPHRYPFLLVDRVTSMELGREIKGFKNVAVNEPFFAGHFPGRPIMPGVLIMEAMAQLGGILAFATHRQRPADGFLYYLVGADKTRFKRPVIPGDRLDMEATILSQHRFLMKFESRAYVEGNLVCSAEMLCARQGQEQRQAENAEPSAADGPKERAQD